MVESLYLLPGSLILAVSDPAALQPIFLSSMPTDERILKRAQNYRHQDYY